LENENIASIYLGINIAINRVSKIKRCIMYCADVLKKKKNRLGFYDLGEVVRSKFVLKTAETHPAQYYVCTAIFSVPSCQHTTDHAADVHGRER